jgi:hypothetical protein
MNIDRLYKAFDTTFRKLEWEKETEKATKLIEIWQQVEELLGDDYEPVNTKPSTTTVFKYEE